MSNLIKEVKVNVLRSYQDYTDEYYTDVDVDFILEIPVGLHIFGFDYVIDRVKMHDLCDEIYLKFANENEIFENFKIPKALIKEILGRIIEEQKDGLLNGWSFDEDVEAMLEEGVE